MLRILFALIALVTLAAGGAFAQAPACTYQNCPADLQFRTPLRSTLRYFHCEKPVRTAMCNVVCRVRCCCRCR